MWRDRWFRLGLVGSVLACLACVTPVAALALGVIGLGAWAGHLDIVLVPMLAAFVLLAAYRYWAASRRTR
jgi:mercuric ion transport protein